jgi:hypothetical protein
MKAAPSANAASSPTGPDQPERQDAVPSTAHCTAAARSRALGQWTASFSGFRQRQSSSAATGAAKTKSSAAPPRKTKRQPPSSTSSPAHNGPKDKPA